MEKTAIKKEKPAEGRKLPEGLPAEIFGIEMNTNLVHQIATSQMANRRKNVAHTKDRSEVSGGGIKPWRQKGTGRARHGSIRSPLWIGGGATFGPRAETVFKKTIPQKMKRKALFMVLSEKAKQGLVIVASSLKISQPKTKEAVELLKKNSISESFLMVLPNMDKNIILAMRNIPKSAVIQAKDLNCLDALSYKYLIIDKEGISQIAKTFAAKK
ncbi:MAG: 50S ribosomal protein L4 [Candidatus Pacebacteria bacterium]|nr:50S ribosomal protein L4 [Candidatus Paceibacterota bacterium]